MYDDMYDKIISNQKGKNIHQERPELLLHAFALSLPCCMPGAWTKLLKRNYCGEISPTANEEPQIAFLNACCCSEIQVFCSVYFIGVIFSLYERKKGRAGLPFNLLSLETHTPCSKKKRRSVLLRVRKELQRSTLSCKHLAGLERGGGFPVCILYLT